LGSDEGVLSEVRGVYTLYNILVVIAAVSVQLLKA